jgi:hypothetical protein
MGGHAAPRRQRIATNGEGTLNRLDPIAAAETGDKGMGEGGILEIEREGIVDDARRPRGCDCPPFGAASLVEPGMDDLELEPNPSGGTAIRTRTGYRCSASCWARIAARIKRSPCSRYVR